MSPAAQKGKSLLECMPRNTSSKLREVTISLYLALIRPHLDTTTSFGTPVQESHWQLEQVQQSHHDGQVLKHLPWEERPREQGLFRLEMRWRWEDLTAAPSTYEKHWEDRARLFVVVWGGRMRDNRRMVKQDGLRLDIRRNFFPVRTVQQWKRFPGRLYSFHAWHFSRSDSIKSQATCSDTTAGPAWSRRLN